MRHSGVYSLTKPTGYADHREELEADALRSPGYPVFLAPFVSGMPDSAIVTNILVTQALISTLSVLVAFSLYLQFMPPLWALVGSVLTALSPHLITMNVYVLSETLFTFLLLLTLRLFVMYRKHERKLYVLLTGLALGAATLTRPSLQYFVLPMLLLVYFYLPACTRIKAMVTLVLGFLLVIGPWHIRNIVSTGEVSNGTLMVSFLHHGMYPDFQYQGQLESTGYPYRSDPESARISKDLSSVLLEIKQRFTREPAEHLRWFLLDKPLQLWSWNMVQGMGDVFVYEVSDSPYFDEPLFRLSHRLMNVIYYPIVILGLMATIVVWLPRWALLSTGETLFASRCISLLLLYYTALHMIGAPFPRYSIPLQPFLYGMAILGLSMLVRLGRCGARRGDAG